jgi:hypothetical protein
LKEIVGDLSVYTACRKIKIPCRNKSEKDNEPDWLDPTNDRKTPYTDEEIEHFVDGYI